MSQSAVFTNTQLAQETIYNQISKTFFMLSGYL